MATKTKKKAAKRKTAKKSTKKRVVQETPEPRRLTGKQQRFVQEYCVDFNATQAAIRSGYSKKVAYHQGYENLNKPQIGKAIKKHMDHIAMSSEEALQRLTRFARGDIGPFIGVNSDGEPSVVMPLLSDGSPDPDAMALIKKIKIRQNTSKSKDGEEITTTTTEFELEDRQAAIDKMLKAHRVYTDGANVKVDFGESVTINIVPG